MPPRALQEAPERHPKGPKALNPLDTFHDRRKLSLVLGVGGMASAT